MYNPPLLALNSKGLTTDYIQGYDSPRQFGLILGKKLLQSGNNIHFIGRMFLS